MWVAAGNATEPFEDWVVGHGELWSAQLLAAAVRKVCRELCSCKKFVVTK
jgi:aspartokinase